MKPSPTRTSLRNRIVAITTGALDDRSAFVADTVLRAWWRRGRVTGRYRLTRVELRKRGECIVTSLSVVGGEGQFAKVPLVRVQA